METNQRSSFKTCSFNRRRKKAFAVHAQKSRLKQSGGSFPDRLPPQCAGADIHVAKRESAGERRRWAAPGGSMIKTSFHIGSRGVIQRWFDRKKESLAHRDVGWLKQGRGRGGGNEQGTINVQLVHNTFSQTARCELHTCCLSLPRRRHVCTRVRITCLT